MDRMRFVLAVGERAMMRWGTACILVLGMMIPAQAQQLPSSYLKSGPKFRSAFRPAVLPVRGSVLRLLSDGEPVALGAVVRADGYLISKASQLRGALTVLLRDGQEALATVAAVDVGNDLALVRVELPDSELQPISWSEGTPDLGTWLVSAGASSMPVGVGVVSVPSRAIAHQRGVLGIILAEEDGGATVARVFPGSAAATAGLQVGDVITTVAGEIVATRDALMNRLATRRPGETLPLIVRRGQKEEQVNATLGNEWSAFADRQARQNLMGGSLSVRSGGFDAAVQHDTVLQPEDCGGPVVNLDGEALGLNIARAGRVESYYLPAAAVKASVAKMFESLDGSSLQVTKTAAR